MSTLKLRPWVKVTLAVIITACVCATLFAWREKVRDEARREVEEYKMCILDQHYTHGWIVRSDCSLNWKYLDTQAGFEYYQVGYDLYLSTK